MNGRVLALGLGASSRGPSARWHPIAKDAVFLDGVYVPGADDAPEFRALSRLSTADVADALQVARARILGYLSVNESSPSTRQ